MGLFDFLKKKVSAEELIAAAESGNTTLLKALLEKGADVNATTKNDATALMVASIKGHIETVKLLIEHGANVNAVANMEGTTALAFASNNGQSKIVKLLLENGADVNEKAKMLALQKGYTEIVDLLTAKEQDDTSTTDTQTEIVSENNETIEEQKAQGDSDYEEWDMVFVEGGVFNATLGDTDEDGHEIVINKKVEVSDFYIGRYPVTRAQWFSVMNGEVCEEDGYLPIDDVSWEDAQEFISKLNEQTGKKFRLPSATEWEYAAIGGKQSKGYRFSGSNNADEVAWHNGNSDMKPHPVGLKKANELGIHDMSGNVWEWCADRWGNYQNLPTFGNRQMLNMMRAIVLSTGNTKALEDIERGLANPQEPKEGAYRVRRGCSYMVPTPYVHDSIRFTEVPNDSRSGNGFRLAHDKFHNKR
jgi:formylglycine-generating enzyme required for sulfatase activity